MDPFILKDEKYFLIEKWNKIDNRLIAGFSTKNGGASSGDFSSLNLGFHVNDDLEKVRNNRILLGEALRFPVRNWVGAEQTHEAHIEKVGKKDRGKGSLDYGSSFSRTDGFFTKEKGVLLTLCYADCVPLFFYAPKQGAVAIAHAGWKGSVQKIAAKTVEMFAKEEIDPKDIYVVIGPSICNKCYVVSEPVIKTVQKALEHRQEKPYNLIRESKYTLDLKMLNELILLEAGIPKENIDRTKYCTSCDENLFFSHRRSGGSTGRMVAFAGWKEDKDE